MLTEKFLYLMSAIWFLIAIVHTVSGSLWALASLALALAFLVTGIRKTGKRKNPSTDTEKN